jgi:hypothetical protein
MAQDKLAENRFGGEYMIQDRNHMSEITPATDKANRGDARQAEQGHAVDRQQAGDDRVSRMRQAQ